MRNLNQFQQFFYFSFIPKSKLISKITTMQIQRATESTETFLLLHTNLTQRRATPGSRARTPCSINRYYGGSRCTVTCIVDTPSNRTDPQPPHHLKVYANISKNRMTCLKFPLQQRKRRKRDEGRYKTRLVVSWSLL